jgi:hypothetical protein
MELLRKKKFAIVFCLLFLTSIQMTYAKGFGTETSTTTEQCGACVCTYTVSTFYLFWIPINTTKELTGTDCSGIL